MEEWRACPVIEEAKSLLNNYFTDLSQELKEMFKTRCRELGCNLSGPSHGDLTLVAQN